MPASTMGSRAQRTSSLIQAKAREVFLAKGYFGTNIEDIAEAAGVSRASFYTYFPSKRDVLLRLGSETYEAMADVMDTMMAIARARPDDAIERMVSVYLDFLDAHGGFVLVWGQAGFGDEDLRRHGMRSKLAGARMFGEIIRELGWEPADVDPTRVALAWQVMIDRYWYYWRVAGLRDDRDDVIAVMSTVIRGTVGGNP